MESIEKIRKIIWDLLDEKNVTIFPRPVHGRIPNFIGANIAAEKLNEITIWKKARIIKSNPDSPQKWVREKALKHGKTVYMAIPRLREEKCFLKINPKKIPSINQASTIKGAFRYGEKVYPDEMAEIDIIIIGSVAVNKQGAKIGKGGGFSDLEYAIAREYGIINQDTPIVTTVHHLQVVEDEIPMYAHDVPLSYIVTRGKAMKTVSAYPKPSGIHWHIIGGRLKEIPILQRLNAKNR